MLPFVPVSNIMEKQGNIFKCILKKEKVCKSTLKGCFRVNILHTGDHLTPWPVRIGDGSVKMYAMFMQKSDKVWKIWINYLNPKVFNILQLF